MGKTAENFAACCTVLGSWLLSRILRLHAHTHCSTMLSWRFSRARKCIIARSITNLHTGYDGPRNLLRSGKKPFCGASAAPVSDGDARVCFKKYAQRIMLTHEKGVHWLARVLNAQAQ